MGREERTDGIAMTCSSPAPALIDALLRLLRPLVRLMLARGLTYPMLIEHLKRLFVNVAEQEFRLVGKENTDSRISLLTGVHRKEVRRLRGGPAETCEPMPEVVSLGGQLVALWLGQAPFVDRDGRPRPLPRLASVGGEASFEALVGCVSKDIRSRAVLDEWLRLGVVNVDASDRVVLQTDGFVPEVDSAEKSFYFGHNLHDHAAAATHNLLGGQPPWLERCVYYDSLTPASVARLHAEAHELGMEVLRVLSRSASELQQQDAQDDALRDRRFTCGIYFYSEAASRNETPEGKP